MDIRILVVEDSEITRGLISAVVQTRDWTVCGEAENGLAGVKQFESLRPDVVVIDLTMPGINESRWPTGCRIWIHMCH